MKKTLKNISCFILAGIMTAFCACVNNGTNSGSNDGPSSDDTLGNLPETPNYTRDAYEFNTVFSNGEQKKLGQYSEDISHEEGCIVYNVYSKINDKNYIKLELETDVDLVGYINYYNVDNKEETNSEKFFIKSGSKEFTTFLDAFRKGARGDFNKTISTISFQNVDETKIGTFTFKSLGVSDRSLDTYEEWRISNGDTMMGTSPFYGGCITYLEKLEQDVYEYMDYDGNIKIDRYIDPDYDAMQVISDQANLINIFDLGREIQPSYYSRVTEENGYTPDCDPADTDSYYNSLGGRFMYNPIQCGDWGGHTPQIIDYVWKEDYLYVKMKAQEWFFNLNIQANGYIECTYYFDEGGAVRVDNVYTDFSCFVGEHDIQINAQETPAVYLNYPLNYFYCETKQGVIFDPNLAEQNGVSMPKTSLKASVSSAQYYYAINEKYMINDWCAFVNENKFGVGIFMPNANQYIASRGRTSTNYFSEAANRAYDEDFHTFGDEEIVPSYAAMNYNYINPCLHRKMVDFVPLEYSYALYIGDTDEMGAVFGRLRDEGILTNAHLLDKTQGWPQE